MSRLVIFKAPYEELRKAEISPTFPGGGSSDILCQYLDYADSAPPKVGDRTQNLEAMAISKPHPLAGAPGK